MKIISFLILFLTSSISYAEEDGRSGFKYSWQFLKEYVENGTAELAEKGEIEESASVSEEYGLAGWKIESEVLYLEFFDDYSENWDNPERKTFFIRLQRKLDVKEYLLESLSANERAVAVTTFDKGFLILILPNDQGYDVLKGLFIPER